MQLKLATQFHTIIVFLYIVMYTEMQHLAAKARLPILEEFETINLKVNRQGFSAGKLRFGRGETIRTAGNRLAFRYFAARVAS
jgi:hypothetical protein